MSKQLDVTVPDSEILSSEKSKRFTVRSFLLNSLPNVCYVVASTCLLAGRFVRCALFVADYSQMKTNSYAKITLQCSAQALDKGKELSWKTTKVERRSFMWKLLRRRNGGSAVRFIGGDRISCFRRRFVATLARNIFDMECCKWKAFLRFVVRIIKHAYWCRFRTEWIEMFSELPWLL